MTFREKLADWISGGALTRAICLRDIDRAQLNEWVKKAFSEQDKWLDARETLRKIAAEEKPTSNATVRRMAKWAREALE